MVHRILSLVAKEKILPGTPLLATNAIEMEVTIDDTNNRTKVRLKDYQLCLPIRN
jgi:hypothetical protein